MIPILLVFFPVAFFYPVSSSRPEQFLGPVDFTYQCGFCVLIDLFVALDPSMPWKSDVHFLGSFGSLFS
jgi:hypothetical protein